MKMLMPSHVTCEACGHGWVAEDLEVVEVEPGAVLTVAYVVECPSCHLLLEFECGPIRLHTAWQVSRGAGQLIDQHSGSTR